MSTQTVPHKYPLASRYSPQAELANIITHAVGVGLSIVALCLMVIYAATMGDPYRIVSVSIFGTTMIFLYSASTLYHAARKPFWKYVFRILDHACIYLLIAGTYTPFTLVSLRGAWGWSLFSITWGLALCGIFFKIFLIGRWEVLSVVIYVGMGWLGVVAAKPVIDALPIEAIAWLTAGGLLYTLGVAFYAWRGLPYHHAIWHVFVLGGTATHFVAVYWYVLPGNG